MKRGGELEGRDGYKAVESYNLSCDLLNLAT
jgi:hypothetical protein